MIKSFQSTMSSKNTLQFPNLILLANGIYVCCCIRFTCRTLQMDKQVPITRFFKSVGMYIFQDTLIGNTLPQKSCFQLEFFYNLIISLDPDELNCKLKKLYGTL